jgi:effector-binding domain-containing protein
LKENNKKAKGAPYDVYMDDPTTKKTMYEVRTDIIQPYE